MNEQEEKIAQAVANYKKAVEDFQADEQQKIAWMKTDAYTLLSAIQRAKLDKAYKEMQIVMLVGTYDKLTQAQKDEFIHSAFQAIEQKFETQLQQLIDNYNQYKQRTPKHHL